MDLFITCTEEALPVTLFTSHFDFSYCIRVGSKLFNNVFERKNGEISEKWRILKQELRDLCKSHSIVRLAKCRRLLRTGYVARVG